MLRCSTPHRRQPERFLPLAGEHITVNPNRCMQASLLLIQRVPHTILTRTSSIHTCHTIVATCRRRGRGTPIRQRRLHSMHHRFQHSQPLSSKIISRTALFKWDCHHACVVHLCHQLLVAVHLDNGARQQPHQRRHPPCGCHILNNALSTHMAHHHTGSPLLFAPQLLVQLQFLTHRCHRCRRCPTVSTSALAELQWQPMHTLHITMPTLEDGLLSTDRVLRHTQPPITHQMSICQSRHLHFVLMDMCTNQPDEQL